MSKQGDFDDDEEATTVDNAFISEGDIITPVELPRCSECSAVVFHDDFSDVAAALAFGLFTSKQCLASRAQAGQPGSWYWCADRRRYSAWVP